MLTSSDSIELRCLALTGSFETGKLAPDCFSGLAGDFDGQGMSLGALQWNLGQGTLQPLLRTMANQHRLVMAAAFGGGSMIDSVEAMLRMGAISNQIAWAAAKQDVEHRWLDPWKRYFVALGQTQEFQQIQIEAAGKYYAIAQSLCSRFGLKSDLGTALMFDIAVQNGTISSTVEGLIRADCADSAGEMPWLIAIANRRAEAANPKYIEDTRTRKLTIAEGSGTVHGLKYDLAAQFGIRLQAITPGVVS